LHSVHGYLDRGADLVGRGEKYVIGTTDAGGWPTAVLIGAVSHVRQPFSLNYTF
jgi:hypothetical protein